MPSHKVDLNREVFIKKCQEKYQNNFSYPYIDKEYKNSHSKLTIVCKKCGTTFTKIANDHWSSTFGGCPICKDDRFKEKRSFTYEELKKVFDKVNLLPFEGKKDKHADYVEIACPIHGIYKQRMVHLKNESDCPLCRKNYGGTFRRYSKEFAEERIKLLSGDRFEYDLSDYVNTSTKISFKCKKCGRTFERTLNSFTYNQKCPFCYKEELNAEHTKTTEQYINECKEKYGDAYDYSQTIYTKSDQKVTIKCNDCGRTFSIEANSHLQGHGCPYHFRNKSKAEIELYNYLKDILPNTNIIQNYRENKEIKELDIFIPDKNFGIEYDGLYWHCEMVKDKNYHLNKTLSCNKYGIRLFHIFEDEWNDKKEIIKSMLRNILLGSNNVIYARKCELRDVLPHDAAQFLIANHLQGQCGGKYHYGLYYNNELVSLMVFSKTRHFVGKATDDYELVRFCNKLNTNVIGGASKLLQHFIKEVKPKAIISYADRRWSNGNLYEKLGFTKYNESKPNYYYVIGYRRVYRYNLRKSILIKKYNCPENMPEREFCRQQKWYRIYDCGCLCYKKEIKNLEN